MVGCPKPPRGSFTALAPQHISHLCSLLTSPKSRSVSATESMERFNRDWMRQVCGQSGLALCPATTAEVSAILKYCNTNMIAVCPQGGNTGLVYGSNPVHDEVVLSMERMNSPPQINGSTMSATCDAGVILEVLQQEAKKEGFLAPLDMGSKGSCFIGGNLSTNAGGIHFARYGSMRSNCLGLEVVTANGDVLDLMSSLRKDNAGYDVKQLFIGSEGTLGVITKAELKLHPYPASRQLIMLQVQSFKDVLSVFKIATATLCECLSAFEVMDAESLSCAATESYPFEHRTGSFSILVETNGAVENHDFEKLAEFEKKLHEDGVSVINAVTAMSEEQNRKLWQVREELPVKLAQAGTIYKFDVSFPLHQFYSVVEHIRRVAREERGIPAQEVLIVGYGHFGDGNVHLNVVDKTRGKYTQALDDILYPGAYEFTAKANGSVSAEHGIGLQKRNYLGLSRSPEVVAVMRSMKAMMDPNGILNPYKVL